MDNTDPFATSPGSLRAKEALKAAEVPIEQSYKRASRHCPVGDMLYLKHIEGQEVLIYNITPSQDDYGPCADLLVVPEGEKDAVTVRAGGFLADKLIGIRDKVESREADYPMLARFRKVAIKGGKTCWTME